MPEPVLELRSISKSYPEGAGGAARLVLDRLDAAFARGEATAIVGRSGSGKSTLLNIASGIDAPDAGEVVYEGVDVARLGDRARTLHRRRRIGFVFQFFNLVPTLTVEENLRLPLELNRVPAEEADARVARLLDTVSLGGRRASFPDALSGGEQQRVAVARALVHEPGVVLADEPTGNLDAVTGAHVLDLLLGLARERGATVVLATHSESAAARADRVLAIESGRLR